MSREEIEELLRRFENCEIPTKEWTHQVHLIVAVAMLFKYDFSAGICRLRSGIILLNSSHDTPNTGDSGYHETITIFWTRVISIFIKMNGHLTVEKIVAKFLASPLSSKELPFQFYDKATLLSSSLRAIYKEPDLLEISDSTIRNLL